MFVRSGLVTISSGHPNKKEVKVRRVKIIPCKSIIITDLDGDEFEYDYPDLLSYSGYILTKLNEDKTISVCSTTKNYLYLDYIKCSGGSFMCNIYSRYEYMHKDVKAVLNRLKRQERLFKGNKNVKKRIKKVKNIG